jgi:hypothetical protein
VNDDLKEFRTIELRLGPGVSMCASRGDIVPTIRIRADGGPGGRRAANGSIIVREEVSSADKIKGGYGYSDANSYPQVSSNMPRLQNIEIVSCQVVGDKSRAKTSLPSLSAGPPTGRI